LKQKLLLGLFIFSSFTLIGQSIKRAAIKGVVSAKENDIEGIVIYNTSANIGTVTNEKGEFAIEITLNDKIEIFALQFQSVSVKIDEEVLKTNFIRIQLVEQVNQLDAVLLSSGLSGNLFKDISDVKTVETIAINMGNMNMAYEYNDDMAFNNSLIENSLKSITNKGELYNGFNPLAIAKLIFKPKKNVNKPIEQIDMEQTNTIMSIFSEEFIINNFNISPENLEAFIGFINEKDINPELLETKNEIQLIDYLFKQSELFLKIMHAKK
jgi:hypothetical protein